MSSQSIIEYYRCPQELLDCHVVGSLKASDGYFRFGQDLICYGQTSGYTHPTVNGALFDASAHVHRHKYTCLLPFDLTQAVNNLRYERYVDQASQELWFQNVWVKKFYYILRPLLPVSLRKHLQKV